MAAPYYYSPTWNATQFFDNNGKLLAGGTITTYEGGSFTVEAETFDGQNGIANTNPIVLDADGRIDTAIWLERGLAYNFVLRDIDNNQIAVAENVIGIEPSSVDPGTTANVWNSTTTPSYISANQFSVAGNQTVEFEVGNRVQFINGVSTYGYGTVDASSYNGSITQVTLQNDSTILAANLSAVFWSALVVSGKTGDAGAISYTSGVTYSNAATVGGQITNVIASVSSLTTTVNTGLADRRAVYTTAGTFSAGGTPFTLTPTPAATGLTTFASYDVIFNDDGGTNPTLNISGLGAQPLVQLDDTGGYVAAVITTGLATRLFFGGAEYVITNPIPPTVPPAAAAPQTGRVAANGTAINLPAGWSSSAAGANYTVTHNKGHTNYNVVITCDTFSDRVTSAGISAINANDFQYTIRSVFDKATTSQIANTFIVIDL